MLSRKQKLEFHENGYISIPGVVPQLMVDAARQAINHSIGAVGMNEGDLERYRAQSYCSEIREAPEIVNLFSKTPVRQISESLMGEGNVQIPNSGQIALRFPWSVTHRSQRTERTPRWIGKREKWYGKRSISAWVYCARCDLSCRCPRTVQWELYRLAQIAQFLRRLF